MKSGSTGSRTRSELKKLKRKFKKGLNISRPALSRILSGKARLSVRALYRIMDGLDLESAKTLLAAYLTDLIPRKLQDQLCVCVRVQQKGDCCWQYWDPFVQKILQLPSEPRSLLERVTDAILHPLGESLLPPGSRDHTQAQGENVFKKIARFPLIPLLVSFFALFAVSPDCQQHYSAIVSDCPDDDPILHSEIINEQKLL